MKKNKELHEQLHEVAVELGYVPPTCTLDGELVMLLVSKREDPCARCNEDRNVCQGRPRRDPT